MMKNFLLRICSFANHDFCPWANRYVYWLKKPIGWVVSSIAFSILIGLFVGSQGFVLAFAFSALLILGVIWPWLSMKGIRSKIVFPDGRLSEGEEFHVLFQIQNYWPLPVFGLIIKGDFLQELGVDEEPVAFSLKRVPAWSQADFRIPIAARRRGIMPTAEVELVNGFPFGLVDISKSIAVPKPALVWPACQPLAGQPEAVGTSYNMWGSLSDTSGNDGETIGVRPYQDGDRLRNIHWAQTVRTQNLMVRERQRLTATAATIVLDLDPATHTGHGVHNSFEWAIRIAASICWQLHQCRSNVHLLVMGLKSLENPTTSNHAGIKPVMDSLANLPTLDQARQQEDEGSLCREKLNMPSQQSFLIGTELSNRFSNLDDHVTSVMLELAGFQESTNSIDRAPSTSSPKAATDMLITAPQLAGDQLSLDWTRSFCHATR